MPSNMAPKNASSTIPTSQTNPTHEKSPRKGRLDLGIGMSVVASLLGLLIILIAIFSFLKYSRKRPPRMKTNSNRQSTFQVERNSSLNLEVLPIKSELPTPFNAPMTMPATFLSKYELPGAENERSSGPFEYLGNKVMAQFCGF